MPAGERGDDLRHPADLAQVGAQRLVGARVLHLDRDLRGRRPRPPGAPARWRRRRPGCAENEVKLSRQRGPSSRARTACTREVGIGGAESCSRASCCAVRAGDVVGQHRLEQAQRLPELHRPALELAEHLEQLLRGPLLQLLADLLGGRAADPSAEAEGRAARRSRGGARPAARCGASRRARCGRRTSAVSASARPWRGAASRGRSGTTGGSSGMGPILAGAPTVSRGRVGRRRRRPAAGALGVDATRRAAAGCAAPAPSSSVCPSVSARRPPTKASACTAAVTAAQASRVGRRRDLQPGELLEQPGPARVGVAPGEVGAADAGGRARARRAARRPPRRRCTAPAGAVRRPRAAGPAPAGPARARRRRPRSGRRRRPRAGRSAGCGVPARAGSASSPRLATSRSTRSGSAGAPPAPARRARHGGRRLDRGAARPGRSAR